MLFHGKRLTCSRLASAAAHGQLCVVPHPRGVQAHNANYCRSVHSCRRYRRVLWRRFGHVAIGKRQAESDDQRHTVSDAKALLVTFSGSHGSPGWGGRFFQAAVWRRNRHVADVDLKKLVDRQDLLGVGTLPAGHYTQVRLVVSAPRSTSRNASTVPMRDLDHCAEAGRSALEITSGEVRLNRQFDVGDSGATTMLIDFDGDRSVTETGNGRFRMTPVIGIVSVLCWLWFAVVRGVCGFAKTSAGRLKSREVTSPRERRPPDALDPLSAAIQKSCRSIMIQADQDFTESSVSGTRGLLRHLHAAIGLQHHCDPHQPFVDNR